MNITAGVASGQVLQRGASGTASFRIQGSCDAAFSGPVMVQVLNPDGEPAGAGHGTASEGAWAASMDELPTGGPYTVDVSCGSGACSVEDILVGEVWVLAGSEMEGMGPLRAVEPPCPSVRVMDLADRWQIAEEPLHWPLESVDRAHWPGTWEMRQRLAADPHEREKLAREQRGARERGAGLGLPFGVALSKALNCPVGLIACARRGSSMMDWNDTGDDSLYAALLRRVRKAELIRGILWYQGADDTDRASLSDFADRFRALDEDVHNHLWDAGVMGIPLLYVQLGRCVSPSFNVWNRLQEEQRSWKSSGHTALLEMLAGKGVEATPELLDSTNHLMVSSVDLELEGATDISTAGLRVLGQRLAILARATVYGERFLQAGPRPGKIYLEGASGDVLRVEYQFVNGALTSAGRLGGFSLRKQNGDEIPCIFRQEIDAVQPHAVLLWLTGPLPPGSFLHYGWGADPYCNLVDEAGMAAPVFGPVTLLPA